MLTGCLVVGPARAWDSPGGQTHVPPHTSAWVDAWGMDTETVIHWKFSTDADRAAAAWDRMLDVDIKAIAADSGVGLQDAEGPREPTLIGNARAAPDQGRFGGGLALGGNGYAQAGVPLPALTRNAKGFTLDFWFRADATAPGEAQAVTLFSINDVRNREFIAARLLPEGRVTLEVDTAERLSVPVARAPGDWHHLVFVVDRSSRGTPDVILSVDTQTVTRETPEWLQDVDSRIGSRLTIGGAPDRPGVRGWVDEIRLSRGRRHVYQPLLFSQQRGEDFVEAPVAPPYFRDDAVHVRVRFDGDLAAEIPAGARHRGSAEDRHFQTGIRGQALDISRIEDIGFALDDVDLFPNLTGTLEFWMRPLDWNNFYVGDYHGRDITSFPFLGLRPPDAMRHMTLGEGNATRGLPTQEVRIPTGRAGAGSRGNWTKLHPGTWTHVAIVASGRERGQSTVYLNGVPHGQVTVRFLDSIYGNVRRPDDRFGPGRLTFNQTGTLIDELSAYPWAMNRDEIHNLYSRWLPDAEAHMRPLPPMQIRLGYRAHNWDGRERLHANVSCLMIDNIRPSTVDLELQDADGVVLHTLDRQALDENGNTRFQVIGALPFGHYRARIRAFDDAGRVLKAEWADYERVRPAWFGNTLGDDRTVPAPWIPMTVDGQTIRLWGRELMLGTGGLPDRITTLERPVLAAPVSVTVSGAAGLRALTGSGTTVTEMADDRVSWRATLTGGGIRGELEAWMEFDGLLYYAINLFPEGAASAQIETLHIDVPMNPAETGQLIANGGGTDFRNAWDIRLIPDGQGRVWDGLKGPVGRFDRAVKNFIPHLWLGGDIAGLYVGAENDQGWTLDGDIPAQEVRRERDALILRMNVIREPIEISAEGRRFHFVLHPTPAKPAPTDWRTRMRDDNGEKPRYWFGAMDVFGGFHLNENPDNPGGGVSAMEPHCWDHAASMSAEIREKWGMTILMANASWPGPGPAFRDWNHDMWAGTGRVAWTPAFIDYTAWAINAYLERDIIDGIYFDDVSIGRTLSLASTGYDLPDGTRRLGFTALAQRRMLMRLWRLFLAHGKEPELALHMTYSYEVPMFSFVRYLFNGEVFARTDFMDVWPPDRLRVMAGADKWGTGIQWVTHGLDAGDAHWSYLQNRALDGNYMATDVLAEGIPNGHLVRQGMLAPGVRAYPFWLSHEVLALETSPGVKVVAAVYAHADRAIVVVTNYERDEHETRMALRVDRVFPEARHGVAWRDIDTGLRPPVKTHASRDEIRRATESRTADNLFGARELLDDDFLTDLLEDSTPEERAMRRLEFEPGEQPVRTIVRPRDYRIFDVRPRQPER